MPTYHYEALRVGGERTEGVVEAADRNQAVAQIRQSCEVVLRLDEIAAPRQYPLEKFQKLNLKLMEEMVIL